MGRKSTKSNKNIYQQTREDLGYSRKKVEDDTDGMLPEHRLEKIENGTSLARPDEIIQMADLYNCPEICNHYCANECEIGSRYVPRVDTVNELPQITLELLSCLNALNKDKDRMIDISADGIISDSEREDFEKVKDHLAEMELSIQALKLWADKRLCR